MLLFSVRKNSQGFTLIEIVVILFIIGILSAIATPSFLAVLNRAKKFKFNRTYALTEKQLCNYSRDFLFS